MNLWSFLDRNSFGIGVVLVICVFLLGPCQAAWSGHPKTEAAPPVINVVVSAYPAQPPAPAPSASAP